MESEHAEFVSSGDLLLLGGEERWPGVSLEGLGAESIQPRAQGPVGRVGVW